MTIGLHTLLLLGQVALAVRGSSEFIYHFVVYSALAASTCFLLFDVTFAYLRFNYWFQLSRGLWLWITFTVLGVAVCVSVSLSNVVVFWVTPVNEAYPPGFGWLCFYLPLALFLVNVGPKLAFVNLRLGNRT